MKNLSPLLLAPILAAVLLLACTPTTAARRVGRSVYDGTWSVAIYTLRGDCGSVRVVIAHLGTLPSESPSATSILSSFAS
jgi:hypothetical protein